MALPKASQDKVWQLALDRLKSKESSEKEAGRTPDLDNKAADDLLLAGKGSERLSDVARVIEGS